jgi:hypothetical protein
MLAVTGDSPQYGLLGDISGRRMAIDLNQTHAIRLSRPALWELLNERLINVGCARSPSTRRRTSTTR